MRPSKNIGLTLIELIVSLAIISILNSLLSPSINNGLSQLKARFEINQLLSFISDARKYALLHKKNVHICSLDSNTNYCIDHWKNDLSSFIDYNKNQRFDIDNDTLLNSLKLDNKQTTLKSTSLKYINFNTLGMNNNIGSMIFCYQNNETIIFKKISASMQGRFKVYPTDKEYCAN